MEGSKRERFASKERDSYQKKQVQVENNNGLKFLRKE
jgi:hypothetical protein